MPQLKLTGRAKRDIEALPVKTKEQIEDTLRALAADPRGISLKGRWEGYKRIRSGDYRIIYKISGDEIIVHYVRHRREAYRT